MIRLLKPLIISSKESSVPFDLKGRSGARMCRRRGSEPLERRRLVPALWHSACLKFGQLMRSRRIPAMAFPLQKLSRKFLLAIGAASLSLAAVLPAKADDTVKLGLVAAMSGQ